MIVAHLLGNAPHPISSSLIFPPRKLACWSEIMRLALFTGSWRIYKGSKDVPLIHALCSHWLIMILYLAMLLKNDSRVGTIPIEVNTWDEFLLKGGLEFSYLGAYEKIERIHFDTYDHSVSD